MLRHYRNCFSKCVLYVRMEGMQQDRIPILITNVTYNSALESHYYCIIF